MRGRISFKVIKTKLKFLYNETSKSQVQSIKFFSAQTNLFKFATYNLEESESVYIYLPRAQTIHTNLGQ